MEKGKYERLIDAETWAFIDRTDSWYPPETATFPVEKQRQIYDAMCREFFAGNPQGVTAEDGAIAGKNGGDLRFVATASSMPIRLRRSSTCTAAALSSGGSTAMTMSVPNCASAPDFR